ncbi:hypothetical protein MY4824_005756 [Beauveria thailandica]
MPIPQSQKAANAALQPSYLTVQCRPPPHTSLFLVHFHAPALLASNTASTPHHLSPSPCQDVIFLAAPAFALYPASPTKRNAGPLHFCAGPTPSPVTVTWFTLYDVAASSRAQSAQAAQI